MVKKYFSYSSRNTQRKKKVKPNGGCKILIGGILVLLNILTWGQSQPSGLVFPASCFCVTPVKLFFRLTSVTLKQWFFNLHHTAHSVINN